MQTRLKQQHWLVLPFEFVIKKGQFKKGDTVLYFPIDSLIPQWVLEKLGLVGKLSGSEKIESKRSGSEDRFLKALSPDLIY
jgi:hypothetical protein